VLFGVDLSGADFSGTDLSGPIYPALRLKRLILPERIWRALDLPALRIIEVEGLESAKHLDAAIID